MTLRVFHETLFHEGHPEQLQGYIGAQCERGVLKDTFSIAQERFSLMSAIIEGTPKTIGRSGKVASGHK